MSSAPHRLWLFGLFPLFAATAHAQDWRLYQFLEHETFRYRVSRTENGSTTTGSYRLSAMPADEGRMKIAVEGQIGDLDCSASVTVESSEAVPQLMMMHCMMIAPMTMVLFTPTWAWFLGRSWELGDHWSMSQGDESLSFRIDRHCTHAGRRGVLGVMEQNGQVRLESCVDTDLPLPLAVAWREDDGDAVEMTLVEYHR